MNELLTAIEAKWAATAALVAAFPGGLHKERPADDQDYGDYCVYHVLNAPRDHRFGIANVPYTASIQFDGVFSDASVAPVSMELIASTFDAVVLTLTGGRTNTMVRCLDEPFPLDSIDQAIGAVVTGLHWCCTINWTVN